MNTAVLPNEIAEELSFRWLGGERGLLLVPLLPAGFEQADEVVRAVLPGFLAVGRWSEVTGLTRAIANHFSYGTDDRGVIFHNPPEADAPRQVGLSIEDGTDNELRLSEFTFFALAFRWLSALRDGAMDTGDEATEAEWWSAWSDSVTEIGRRAGRAA